MSDYSTARQSSTYDACREARSSHEMTVYGSTDFIGTVVCENSIALAQLNLRRRVIA